MVCEDSSSQKIPAQLHQLLHHCKQRPQKQPGGTPLPTAALCLEAVTLTEQGVQLHVETKGRTRVAHRQEIRWNKEDFLSRDSSPECLS